MSAQKGAFDRFATAVADKVGTPAAFAAFLLSVLLWFVTGPMLGFSDAWQLLINTPTTVVTTGLVIIVQYTQNKDSRAIHLKLDVLIDATAAASNRFAGVDQLPAKELVVLRERVDRFIAQHEGDGR